MFSPFDYSDDKEKVSGYNDEQFFQLNGKEKVKVEDYFKMI